MRHTVASSSVSVRRPPERGVKKPTKSTVKQSLKAKAAAKLSPHGKPRPQKDTKPKQGDNEAAAKKKSKTAAPKILTKKKQPLKAISKVKTLLKRPIKTDKMKTQKSPEEKAKKKGNPIKKIKSLIIMKSKPKSETPKKAPTSKKKLSLPVDPQEPAPIKDFLKPEIESKILEKPTFDAQILKIGLPSPSIVPLPTCKPFQSNPTIDDKSSPFARKQLIGKVKPIARVKGTIIPNVKPEIEKKKEENKEKTNEEQPIVVPIVEITETALVTPVVQVETDLKEVTPKMPVLKGLKIHKKTLGKCAIMIKPKLPKKKRTNKNADAEFENCTFSINEEKLSEQKKKKKSKTLAEIASAPKVDEPPKEKKSPKKVQTVKALDEDPNKKRLKLFGFWTGPKQHRVASLNALAKVQCLYENENRTHMELGLMRTIERSVPIKIKGPLKKKEKVVKEAASSSESEYERKIKVEMTSSSEDEPHSPPVAMTLRGARSEGKYWDPKTYSSSDDENEMRRILERKKAIMKASVLVKSDEADKPPSEKLKSEDSKSDEEAAKPEPKAKIKNVPPVKRRRKRAEVVMDLKDMVVRKRMASLNATAILAASYEKRSPKSGSNDSTSDSFSSDRDSVSLKRKTKSVLFGKMNKADPDSKNVEVRGGGCSKQKVEVIVNQDTDVTITGVYSAHHSGFCTTQYRIQSTSHTKTTATTSNDQDVGIPSSSGTSGLVNYAPLAALSSMQPPTEQKHAPHPKELLDGLNRRRGGPSAFSAPSPHHNAEDACKKRWCNIRDQFKKHMNKRKTKSGQGAMAIKKYKYEDNLNFLLPHIQHRSTITTIESENEETQNEVEAIESAQNTTHDETEQANTDQQQQAQRSLASLQPNFTPATDPNPNPHSTAQFTSSKSRNRRQIIPQSQPSASSTLMEYIIKNNEKSKTQVIHPIDAFFNSLAATTKSFSPYYQHVAKGKIFAVIQDLEWEQLSANPSSYTSSMSGTSSCISTQECTPVPMATPRSPKMTPLVPTPLESTPPEPIATTSTTVLLDNNNMTSSFFSQFSDK